MPSADLHDHTHTDHHDHGHDHDHRHSHSHDPIEVTKGAGEYEIMVHAIKELLIEKGVITSADIRKTLEFMDTRGPALGAKIVSRAWTDPEFKKRLLANGTAAVAEMGIPMGDAELIVVENTKDVHNVIVCTLCSCYPRTILGLPPDWYKSRNYRSRVVAQPRAVLKEFGTVLPELGDAAHPRFQRGYALPGPARTPYRHRGLVARTTRRNRHPRLYGWRRGPTGRVGKSDRSYGAALPRLARAPVTAITDSGSAASARRRPRRIYRRLQAPDRSSSRPVRRWK